MADHSKANRERVRDMLLACCPNVYFQSPGMSRMKYPAVLYSVNRWIDSYADNLRYCKLTEYLVTVVDSDPDSPIVEKIGELPNCRFDRRYVTNNMYHTVFILKF